MCHLFLLLYYFCRAKWGENFQFRLERRKKEEEKEDSSSGSNKVFLQLEIFDAGVVGEGSMPVGVATIPQDKWSKECKVSKRSERISCVYSLASRGTLIERLHISLAALVRL